MKKRYTLTLFAQKAMYTILALMLLLPTIASATNDSFVPSFKDGMNDLPDNVKFTMTRVINWGQVALVAVAIIYLISPPIHANLFPFTI